MLRRKIVNYVSDIDKKLSAFDSNHELSKSQKAEVEKYKRIYELRDHAKKKKSDVEPWKDF